MLPRHQVNDECSGGKVPYSDGDLTFASLCIAEDTDWGVISLSMGLDFPGRDRK